MESLFENQDDFSELYKLLIAPIRARLLLTGIELEVFNHLCEPESAENLAAAMDTHPANTTLFLNGLAACGLLHKENGLYRNTPVARRFLVTGEPACLGPVFTSWAQMWGLDGDVMSGLVKEGPPSPGAQAAASEEMWGQYAELLAAVQGSGIARQMAAMVSGFPEFSAFERMLDLGGGPGLIGMAIVAAHPRMKGVVFDRPGVLETTARYIGVRKMEDRMETLGGDFVQDPIGGGYDLVWASSVFNFVRQDLDPLIRKIFDALNPGGLLVSCHDGLFEERTKPEMMVLSWLPSALAGADMGMDKGAVADAMRRTGFKAVRSGSLETPMGPMELDVATKP
jgi:hypothetical protein